MDACLRSGFVSSVGPMVQAFEASFARFVGARFAVATASGTAAIHVCLTALGVGCKSIVLVPDLTFVASMNPVLYSCAHPALLDVDRESWCMDPEIIEEFLHRAQKTGRRVAAMLPVHLFGRTCDMTTLSALSRKFRVPVVEDATEALGSRIRGQHVGTFGELGCFSFNGNKMITTGAGGMVVTDSPELAHRIRHLVNQARSDKARFLHSEAGFNYRMSSLAASLGLSQLDRLGAFLRRKQSITDSYRRAFSRLPRLTLPTGRADEQACLWLYSVLLDTPVRREALLRHLENKGIQARRFFEPLHTQPYVASTVWTRTAHGMAARRRGVSNDLAERGLNLPSSVSLSREDQDKVIRCVREFFRHSHSRA